MQIENAFKFRPGKLIVLGKMVEVHGKVMEFNFLVQIFRAV